MKKTVVYVISEVQNAITFEWIANSVLKNEVNLVFVLLNSKPSILENNLKALGGVVVRLPFSGKKMEILYNIFSLFKIFRSLRPDAVHTHLQGANIAGLTAAWMARVPNRIYTRHHSNWNLLGPWHARAYDFFSNSLSTKIVATCNNVKKSLEVDERVSPKKVKVIRFGFDGPAFRNVGFERVQAMRVKYDLENSSPVIGVVSRYITCKGIPDIVKAFSELLRSYPKACLVLANAGFGSASAEIRAALSSLPPESYREIEFENDCPALMQVFDVFVHVPTDPVSEAFGQVYIEALLAGRPSVFTLSGVAPEVVEHERNALVVPFHDAKAIHNSIVSILENPELRTKIARNGVIDANRDFHLDSMISGLRELYR